MPTPDHRLVQHAIVNDGSSIETSARQALSIGAAPSQPPHPTQSLQSLQSQLDRLGLGPGARVWFYVTNRPLTDPERIHMLSALDAFTSQWQAHGTPLNAAATVLLHDIVVLAVDESSQQATGCSIDASVSFLRHLPESLPSLADLDLLDRSWVFHAALPNPNPETADSPPASEVLTWQRSRLHDFWARCKSGTVPPTTPIVDTTIQTLGQPLIQPLESSWHATMW